MPSSQLQPHTCLLGHVLTANLDLAGLLTRTSLMLSTIGSRTIATGLSQVSHKAKAVTWQRSMQQYKHHQTSLQVQRFTNVNDQLWLNWQVQ